MRFYRIILKNSTLQAQINTNKYIHIGKCAALRSGVMLVVQGCVLVFCKICIGGIFVNYPRAYWWFYLDIHKWMQYWWVVKNGVFSQRTKIAPTPLARIKLWLDERKLEWEESYQSVWLERKMKRGIGVSDWRGK